MLFKDLKAYQHARRLSVLSRPLIKRLPDSEADLADQWRRACNSIALNLAEGVSRRGSKEFRRFDSLSPLLRLLPLLRLSLLHSAVFTAENSTVVLLGRMTRH